MFAWERFTVSQKRVNWLLSFLGDVLFLIILTEITS